MAASAPFALRGVIEGFYGRPWSRRDRLDVLAFCAERGMNAYVYAPKDDAKHRSHWREPYTTEELLQFLELRIHCDEIGMRFGFAVSPGLDIDYRSASDREALRSKLAAALDVGARWLVVAFDDLPGRTSEGVPQGELVAWLYDELGGPTGALAVSMVPTEYAGVTPSRYLSALATTLPADVDVAWTGRWVVSPTITAADARARAESLGGRAPLVWDNYPVNDGPMMRSLFLGPYTGRDPELARACTGVLCNPMPLAHASKVGLASAAAFLGSPGDYDPASAWPRAISEVGGAEAGVLATVAEACADSALVPASDLEIHRLLDGFEAGRVPRQALVEVLRRAKEALARVGRSSDPLWREVQPWIVQLHREARAGLAAIKLLAALDDADDDEVADAAHGLQAAWDRARGGASHNVFGPRFACYPAVTSRADGSRVLDLSAGVVEDASGIDRLCRIASQAYAGWREAPGEAVAL